MRKVVIIVEDEFIVADDLRLITEKAGFTVGGIAESVEEADRLIREHQPGIVLLDINLKGDLTGIDLAIKLNAKAIPFIYISAYCTQSILEAANKTNPYGFLVKPFRAKDVQVALDIAAYRYNNDLESGLRRDNLSVGSNHISFLRESQQSHEQITIYNFEGIVGNDPALIRVLDQVKQVAPFDTSVLLLGETGTGKERIAAAIHQLSGRSTRPIVKVNCAALPRDIIESELFGHEKGAFTGAADKRVGKFEQADGGTIFLDEVGELPLEVQSKLLRVLQEKEIERLGGRTTKTIDIRIIAATNRNLEKEVAEGRFRLDLFYRLNVFPLVLPPLRERRSDIKQLAFYFAERICKKHKKKFPGINPEMITALTDYDWPGNIRELENVVEQSVILNNGKGTLELTSLTRNEIFTAKKFADNDSPRSLDEIKIMQRKAERDYIISVLKKACGRIRGEEGAAQMLRLPPTTLESKMAKLKIEKDEYL